MNIIITMAGLGSRFRKAGYVIPKFMIEVRGKTLFEWSMESLSDFIRQKDSKFFFIVRKGDRAKNFINTKTKNLGIKNTTIIEIDELTDGQATTAMLAKPFWAADEGMVVYNIDTYVEKDAISSSSCTGDGFIPCFNAPGNHWSFVKVDENSNATEVREKKRISDNCTIGLYYFKTCNLYEKIYNEYYSNASHMENGEKYIAPLYNHMIKNNLIVKISIIDSKKVHVLGTPEEVEVFRNQ